MRVLVFDTETTGLPKTKIMSPDTLDIWPHIVQFSYVIYDDALNDITESKDAIIKVSENVIIGEDSIIFHGITNEISMSKGVNIDKILNEFFVHLRKCDKIVGHNVSFDINMVKVELLRIIYSENGVISDKDIKEFKLNLHYLQNIKNIYCTLQESIDLCNIKAVNKYGNTYLKYPKLVELHETLFKTTPNNLHNSFNDILVTLRCFVKMIENRDLNIDCVKFKNTAQLLHLL